MKRALAVTAVLLAIISLAADGATAGSAKAAKVKKVLAISSMYGVDGPFLGATNPVNGVNGDDLPWVIKSAKGKLDSNGHLVLKVKGLVFSDDPEVPAELQGTNDETDFRALVTCQTEVGDAVEQHNVISDPFPATTTGNCTINTFLTLPDPCVAPVVFVLAGSEDKWFAVTGIEVGED